MPLSASELESRINLALNAKDVEGNKIQVPEEMKAFAAGLVKWFKASKVFFPLITATSPVAPGAVYDITANKGKILPAPPTIWEMEIKKVTGNGPLLKSEIIKHTSYISLHLVVDFEKGSLQGTSTALTTAAGPVPGVLTLSGKGGKFSGLNAKKWSSQIMPKKADIAKTEEVFKAIIDYIHSKGSVTIPSVVAGTFVGGGAPLAGGVATGFIN